MKTIILIPAFNEEKTIQKVINRCQPFADEIVVIDDGSKDKTSLIAKKNGAKVFKHEVNLGLGAALITGFEAALKIGADIVVTLDADGQHNPEEVPKLVQEIKNGAQFVVGSRMKHKSKKMPALRYFYNLGANLITYLLYGVWSSDSQSGLRAFSKDALCKINLNSQEMEVSSEFFKEVKKHNLVFKEVTIEPIYTKYSLSKGKTSQGFVTGLKTLARLILNKII
ncbi:MAG TPA: glycosyltransferase family 2 protein [Patescibacteria group bacterium]|nr:glycosyltransferase family 2 protein [Patescibacteria group bacterium]